MDTGQTHAACATRASPERKGPFDGLADNVALLVDKTADSLWRVMNRPGPDGINWAEAGGFVSLEAYRRYLASAPDRLVTECRDLLWADHLLEPEEKALFDHVCAMADGLAMLRRAVAEGVALACGPKEFTSNHL